MLMELAAAAWNAGDEAAFDALVHEAVDRFPDHAGVALQVATMLRMTGHDMADAQLRRAARLAAGSPEYLTGVAEQMLEFGDLPAAFELIRQARGLMLEEYPEETFTAEDCLRASVYANVTGRIMAAMGRDDHAEPLLEDAFSLTFRADHGHALASFHAKRGRLDRAREIVAQALEYAPADESLLDLQARLGTADGSTPRPPLRTTRRNPAGYDGSSVLLTRRARSRGMKRSE